MVLQAFESSVKEIDHLQSGFIRDIRITEEMAFLEFNFATLCLRRDIGILGFLHKRVLGECHPGVIALLPYSGLVNGWRHPKQLETQIENCTAYLQLY